MKLIYSGDVLAALVLDTSEEIEAVTLALADFAPRSGGVPQATATRLLHEIAAGAPA